MRDDGSADVVPIHPGIPHPLFFLTYGQPLLPASLKTVSSLGGGGEIPTADAHPPSKIDVSTAPASMGNFGHGGSVGDVQSSEIANCAVS